MSEHSVNPLKVMGPARSVLAEPSNNGNNPPRFVTNVTSKVSYRDELRFWMQMVNEMAEVDTNWKALRKGAGYIIYRSCNQTAQAWLKKAVSDRNLSLSVQPDDPKNEKLIEGILDVIAKDTSTESIKREVDLLTAIHSCSRKEEETVSAFATRFTGTVASYVNHTAGITDGTSRQFAIMMLQNAHLTPDTMNSLVFQLTSSAASNRMDHMGQSLATNAELTLMLNLLKSPPVSKKEAAKALQFKRQDEAKKIQDQRFHKVPIFTLDIAAEYLSHVQSKQQQTSNTPATKTHGSMLGKRSTAPLNGGRRGVMRLKEETKCRACHRPGHWWRDREECRVIMRARRDARRSDSNATPFPDENPPRQESLRTEPVSRTQPVSKSLFQA